MAYSDDYEVAYEEVPKPLGALRGIPFAGSKSATAPGWISDAFRGDDNKLYVRAVNMKSGQVKWLRADIQWKHCQFPLNQYGEPRLPCRNTPVTIGTCRIASTGKVLTYRLCSECEQVMRHMEIDSAYAVSFVPITGDPT